MESTSTPYDPDDPRQALAAADRASHRLSAGLRLPPGFHPALAVAIALQIGTAAWGIAAQTGTGLAVALAGAVVFLGFAALALHRFRQVNGARLDGLTSQVVLGAGTMASSIYVCTFGAATWAAFESQWWLVAAAAATGGAGYALAARQWWRAYQLDPVGHAVGASSRALAVLAAVAGLGLVVLLVTG
ncbi:hypothetical protein Q9S36_22370 [Microbacterium sp. ARD31]|uniref:hypothetical protein n=1 Tax=Microbacterium sp. ARD31 TaxID=2962576 RepID=UPI002881AF3C|nr:hypothetical protein [Microbacterium sp. ARD31]MDT0182928.1 hypothetical protein [Microbacterium sp. ARD31]